MWLLLACAGALAAGPWAAAGCAQPLACDGSTDDTAALQKSIDGCAAAGQVFALPAGKTCLSQPLQLRSNLRLELPAGSVLKAGAKWDDAGSHLVHAAGCSNLSITGSGTIDGSGSQWWRGIFSPSSRPHLVHFDSSTDVEVSGVTLRDAPKFHLVLNGARYTVSKVVIRSPAYLTAPNTDGIQIAAQDVTVTGCDVENGDDSIVVKPGARNVLITDSRVAQGNGLVVGTGGGVQDVVFRNCVVDGTQYGCHIKAKDDQTGVVTNITYDNIFIKSLAEHLGFDAVYAIGINQNGQDAASSARHRAAPLSSVHISHVTFRNIRSLSKNTYGGKFTCNTGALACTNITLSNVTLPSKCSFENVYGAGTAVVPSSCVPPPAPPGP
eukprot:TRINITY_DN25308_c0_g1_i2.p1 TRINITY_DN25308_c0_g1~~TRINITY_DN25308_c0_g1_i2.p1  ORF type:complete len:414 (+),score=142.99 TRINITY_DN25308_c0_g1_i2:97-1242(+)